MKKLSIPERISLEKYWLPGITKKELVPLLCAVTPGVVVTIILWCVLETPLMQIVALGGGIGYAGLCYAIFAKIDGVQSIYNYISRIIRFYSSQRRFYYKHGKEVIYYVGEESK